MALEKIILTREDQLAYYIDCVTGTCPCKPVDLASLMYHYHSVIEDLLEDLLHPEKKYSYDIALNTLRKLSKSFLIEAKFYECIPIQLEIF